MDGLGVLEDDSMVVVAAVIASDEGVSEETFCTDDVELLVVDVSITEITVASGSWLLDAGREVVLIGVVVTLGAADLKIEGVFIAQEQILDILDALKS